MTFLTTILGFLLIIAGVLCFFNPVQTFLAAGIFVGVMFLVYGIAGIIRAFQGKAISLEIILSILSTVLGVFCFVKPGTQENLDFAILICTSIWFIVQGAFMFYVSLRLKGLSWRWILGAIAAILSIALGIFSLVHPIIPAHIIGILVGCYFIGSGISMIALSAVVEIEKKDAGL